MTAQNGKTKRLGRPPTEFTDRQIHQIDRLAFRQCKDTTIAEILGVDLCQFQRHFVRRTRQKRAEGKAVLYTTQFAMGRKQPVMAIWLGKQHLEQTDKADVTSGGQSVADFMAVLGRRRAK